MMNFLEVNLFGNKMNLNEYSTCVGWIWTFQPFSFSEYVIFEITYVITNIYKIFLP